MTAIEAISSFNLTFKFSSLYIGKYYKLNVDLIDAMGNQ